jgi:hypothetical protein
MTAASDSHHARRSSSDISFHVVGSFSSASNFLGMTSVCSAGVTVTQCTHATVVISFTNLSSSKPVWRSLVAQAICNRQVVGSNPSTGSQSGVRDAFSPYRAAPRPPAELERDGSAGWNVDEAARTVSGTSPFASPPRAW